MFPNNNSHFGLKGYSHAQSQKLTSFKKLFSILLTSGLLFISTGQTFGQVVVEIEEISKVGNPNEVSMKMKLYPNPTTDKLITEIEGAEMILAAKTLDLSGRLVQHIKPTILGKSHRLTVSNYPAGTYILQVRTEKGVISKKFSVVKR